MRLRAASSNYQVSRNSWTLCRLVIIIFLIVGAGQTIGRNLFSFIVII